MILQGNHQRRYCILRWRPQFAKREGGSAAFLWLTICQLRDPIGQWLARVQTIWHILLSRHETKADYTDRRRNQDDKEDEQQSRSIQTHPEDPSRAVMPSPFAAPSGPLIVARLPT